MFKNVKVSAANQKAGKTCARALADASDRAARWGAALSWYWREAVMRAEVQSGPTPLRIFFRLT